MDRWINGFMESWVKTASKEVGTVSKVSTDCSFSIGWMGALVSIGRSAPNGTKRHQSAVNGTKNKDVFLVKTLRPWDCAGLSGALECACPSGAFPSMTPMRKNNSSRQRPLGSPNQKRQRDSRTPKPGGLPPRFLLILLVSILTAFLFPSRLQAQSGMLDTNTFN